MKQQTLTRLVHAPADEDYVTTFQELARVNVALHEGGPDAALFARKAILETGLGNFLAAREAATEAVRADSDMSDGYYELGRACALLACVRADVLPGGPGNAPFSIKESVRELLESAHAAFMDSVRLNPGDAEAEADLVVLDHLLTIASDAELEARVRADES